MSANNTAVVVIEKAKEVIAPVRSDFEKVEGLKLAFDKELGFAAQILQANDSLYEAAVGNPDQLRAAIYNVALTGLTLNPVLKYAYLLIRNGKICLEPSYMGFVKILTDAGSVKAVWANVIRATDNYDVQLGTENRIIHNFDILKSEKERGDIVGVYAIAKLANGEQQFEFMQTWEVKKIKARSASVISAEKKRKRGEYVYPTVWEEFESEMYRKTAIRRLFKYLPKTEISEEALNAIRNFDENNAIDFDEPPENSGRLDGVFDKNAANPEPEQQQLQPAEETPAEPTNPLDEWTDAIGTWNTVKDFNNGIKGVARLAQPLRNEVRTLVANRRTKLGIEFDSEKMTFYKPEPKPKQPQPKPEKNGVSNFAF